MCLSIGRTDVYATVPGKAGFRLLKLLSEDPSNYPDAPREGIRRILQVNSEQLYVHKHEAGFKQRYMFNVLLFCLLKQEETGVPHPRDKPLDTSRIKYIRMGTTVATNALLERKGARCALVISKVAAVASADFDQVLWATHSDAVESFATTTIQL